MSTGRERLLALLAEQFGIPPDIAGLETLDYWSKVWPEIDEAGLVHLDELYEEFRAAQVAGDGRLDR